MSYDPRNGPPRNPYPDPRYGRRGGGVSSLIARIITAVTGTVAAIFVLHIVFALTEANTDNAIVGFVYLLAATLVCGFGNIYTPDDATIGLVVNYGIAAIAYLVIGQVIVYLLRRR